MPTTPDAILDAKNAASIPDSGITIHFCSAAPADYAGIAAVDLGNKVVADTPLDSDATPNGRLRTLPAQSGIPTPANGSVTHVVLATGGDTIRLITEMSPALAVTAGGTAGCGAITVRQADPVAV